MILHPRQVKRGSLAYTPLDFSARRTTNLSVIEAEDFLLSKDSMPVDNLENPIPCKTSHKFKVAKADAKAKPTKKENKKGNNKEIDIGFLSAVKKMHKHDMLDSNDDVLLLASEEYLWDQMIGL
jgi:hypothetical protein